MTDQSPEDDVDAALALLLRAGRKEMPPRRALEKTLAGLGAAGTVFGASHGAAAAVGASKLGVLSLVTWAGAGILGGVVTMAGVELVQSTAPNPSATVTAAALATPHSTARSPAPTALSAPALAPPVEAREKTPGTVAPPSQRQRERAAPARTAAPRPTARAVPTDPSIAIEIGLIDEARRALRAGRAEAALEALSRHRTEVKRQRLGPEARYLEMEALHAAGNLAAAKRVARELLDRSPGGPQADRARSILDSAGE